MEKAVAAHSNTLAWKIPWMEEPGRLQSMGSLGIRHDWVTSLSLFPFMHWRRKWQPTPVFLPGESQGWGVWWAAVCGVAQSRIRLKQLSSSSSIPTWVSSWGGEFSSAYFGVNSGLQKKKKKNSGLQNRDTIWSCYYRNAKILHTYFARYSISLTNDLISHRILCLATKALKGWSESFLWWSFWGGLTALLGNVALDWSYDSNGIWECLWTYWLRLLGGCYWPQKLSL